ncbi:POTRA domain-containing protein [Changchengzhania lutea]|uniref:POTRA domain-containing protein n=1 Tax=Changchengzhania lutea TaxID=2049305 RepID=UPI00115C51F0|nr:POTRA domain-containing protein [Changchengzhania lutea]
MQKTSFLFLIIYGLFSLSGGCQNLILQIEPKIETDSIVITALNYKTKHSNYDSMLSEIDSIQNTLYKQGFIENEFEALKRINDSTFFTVLDVKQKYETIHIYYDNSIIDASILNQVSTEVNINYFELPFKAVEKALQFINSKISGTGFPFSKLRLGNIEIIEDMKLRANLIIIFDSNKRQIDNIVIKGYKKFPQAYLKHFLKIKRSQVFDLKKIKEKTERLSNLKFANQIKSPEVLFTKDSTTLYMYLEKAKSNSFDGFLGFGTNEDSNKIEFDGYLNLNLTNNLNFGETFRLLYKSDENDQTTFEGTLSLPYLFNSPIGADLQLRIFRKDSSFSTVNQSAKLHYQLNSKNKIYGGITSTESSNLLNENTSINILDYKSNYATLAYQFLNFDPYNLLFPLKSSIYIESNFGNRKQSSLSEKQTLLELDAFKIFNLNEQNSIYLRINGAMLNSTNYLENELIRFGGINSIRGFEENSLYASQYGLVNSEYRYQLNSSIYIHSIIDFAYFENAIANIKEKLFGYGFGFGILTKSGLLKFNYANGKIENQKFKLSNSKIHLSLIADF